MKDSVRPAVTFDDKYMFHNRSRYSPIIVANESGIQVTENKFKEAFKNKILSYKSLSLSVSVCLSLSLPSVSVFT